jgi:hypothetical protein
MTNGKAKERQSSKAQAKGKAKKEARKEVKALDKEEGCTNAKDA